MLPNYYAILEVPFSATEEQIKKAYRIQAIKFHPDKHNGEEFFTKKFIEIKEAYDLLSNNEERRKYDIEFNVYYKTSEPSQKENTSNETNEKFHKETKREQYKSTTDDKYKYDPYKQFYSIYDRELQDTPQFNPKVDFWGQEIDKRTVFFRLPKKIGKIIMAFSDYFEGEKPLESKEKTKKIIGGIFVVLVSAPIIYFLGQALTLFYFVLPPVLIALVAPMFRSKFSKQNLYVGINGFAAFGFENNDGSIQEGGSETNFNDVTDFYTHSTEYSKNFSYKYTEFVCCIMNRKTNQLIYSTKFNFDKKILSLKDKISLAFMNNIEKYWTVYLLDKMEDTLQKEKCLTFSLYSHKTNSYQEYIKLGIGSITFINTDNSEFTYKFNEIKKVYTKNNFLIIQHKNFEKTFLFFKEGNENKIPLLNLCNRQFFYRAMELLLGYKI